jgi:hypothetical protein
MMWTMEGFSEQFVTQITQFSDRIGQPGNVDGNRFDQIVDEWRMSDDDRNPALELMSIGAQLIKWIRIGRPDIVRATLSELEKALLDGTIPSDEARGFALEVLDGMQSPLLELYGDDHDQGRAADAALAAAMGSETRQLWLPMWSSTKDFKELS